MGLGPYFLGLTEFTALRPVLSFPLAARWPLKNDTPLVRFCCPQISKEKEMRSRRRLGSPKMKQLGGRLSFPSFGCFLFIRWLLFLFLNHCLFNWMEMFTSTAFIVWSSVSWESGYMDHGTYTSFSSHHVHFVNISWAISAQMRAFEVENSWQVEMGCPAWGLASTPRSFISSSWRDNIYGCETLRWNTDVAS